ncbi:MAG: Na/Pi cotransporter family protein [Candidatus Omnitrophica bacterium]|nr:Na/Pi cotransporter family protein [Candidatus Omnitrophota bacterium]MDD5488097.1 Na/Pi cotransporter family protein [Candidatus Omnitrophota bacterium]
MDLNLIFSLIGGLGLFFFGMRLMSDGLKKIAGDRLKKILSMVTKVPFVGLMVGAAVTCLIQSSSATSVMVVGFVNAGLLTLKQAISVIMGANIGTTFTAWLVSSMSVFKVTQYALPAIGIGFAVNAFFRTKNAKFWGQVLMGFGLLFLGLEVMKDAFEPLKDSQYVKDIFLSFSTNPLLGVAVGTIFTIILQSSSATIAVVQVMAFNGLIDLPSAIPIILGDNIGTTITAQLASIGTTLPARRAAMSHTLFNVIGVAYMLVFVYTGWYEKAIYILVPGEVTLKNIMLYIAVAHSFFNVTNSLMFLPFIGFLERASVFMVPKKKGTLELGPQYLEVHLLDTPPIAMEQARRETVRMIGLARRSVAHSVKCFLGGDLNELRPVAKLEQAVDNLQSAITQYLVDLSQRNLGQEESEELPVLIHSVNDIERIGDHSENIVELAERKIEQKLPFSDEAIRELNLMWDELNSMMVETEDALRNSDSVMAESVLKREQKINRFQEDLKRSHVRRLNEGVCDLKAGIVFLDFVDNLEKIGDHLTNIAQGVVGEMRWKGFYASSLSEEEEEMV